MLSHMKKPSYWYCSRCDVQQGVDRGSMQRVFNAIWFILLRQKHDIKIDAAIIITLITWFLPSLEEKLLTLFAPILLHHVRLARSSLSLPMLSLPSLSTDCLTPSPPSPKLNPFPSGPRQRPAPILGTDINMPGVTLKSITLKEILYRCNIQVDYTERNIYAKSRIKILYTDADIKGSARYFSVLIDLYLN